MRAKLLPFILLCSLCSAGCSTLQTKVETQDRDQDGKPDRRISRTYRDGALLLQRVESLSRKDGAVDLWIESVFHKNKRVFVVVCTPAKESRKGSLSHSYYPKAGVGVSEMDGDGDGIFEYVTVHGPAGDFVDIFTREPDGRLSPVSDKRLEEIQGMTDRFESGFRDLVNEDFGAEDDE